MSFSFFGYIHVEPISITTAFLPVLLAGALIGPGSAAAVGAVFGLASMWKASASYVMAADQLFSPLYSGNPLGSMVLSVGTRMLFGLTAGAFVPAGQAAARPWVGVAAVSLPGADHPLPAGLQRHGPLLPGERATAPATPSPAFSRCRTSWPIWPPPGWCCSSGALSTPRDGPGSGGGWRLDETMQAGERSRHWVSLAAVSALSLAFALAVTFYFVHRMDYVLKVNGIALTDTGYTDMLHLQVQFLFGILSMMALLVLFLALNRRYVASMARRGGRTPSPAP